MRRILSIIEQQLGNYRLSVNWDGVCIECVVVVDFDSKSFEYNIVSCSFEPHTKGIYELATFISPVIKFIYEHRD
jgi:hypothetical protein